MNLRKRICVVLVVISMLFSFVCCKEQPDMPIDEQETHNTNVFGRRYIVEYGDHIFYGFGKVLMRYNRKSGEFRKACKDPECKGDCLLESPLTYLSQILDGKLYFVTRMPYVHTYHYVSLDVATDELKVLRTFERMESCEGNVPCISDGYLYYICKKMKPNGNKEDPEDYLTYVCRIPVDGGDEEVVFCFEKNSESLLYVYKEKLLTMYDGKLFLIDPLSSERKVVFDQQKEGYQSFGGDISFLGNQVFFLARNDGTVASNYTEKNFYYSYLVKVDLDTGESGRLIEDRIASFCLTDDTLYYSPFEARAVYIPENAPENAVEITGAAELHACDLQGENDRVVYKNDKLSYTEEYTVINNVLYGRIAEVDEKNSSWGNGFFGTIDFATGVVTRVNEAS